jgi:hypothetical protein
MGDMDDMNNAPMPPMGDGNDMGGDQMMGNEDPNAMGENDPNMMDGQDASMGDQMMGNEGPNAMGGEPSQGNEELDSVVSNLSTEDQAAVLKYAKSMADDNNGEESNGMMPESRRNYRNIIDETINSILYGDDEKVTRSDTRLPKRYRGKNSPFNSPFN